MANWAVDPHPFVHASFMLEDLVPRPPLHHEVYVTGCYTLYNEDLVIVKFNPPVDTADFKKPAEGLHTFFP